LNKKVVDCKLFVSNFIDEFSLLRYLLANLSHALSHGHSNDIFFSLLTKLISEKALKEAANIQNLKDFYSEIFTTLFS